MPSAMVRRESMGKNNEWMAFLGRKRWRRRWGHTVVNCEKYSKRKRYLATHENIYCGEHFNVAFMSKILVYFWIIVHMSSMCGHQSYLWDFHWWENVLFSAAGGHRKGLPANNNMVNAVRSTWSSLACFMTHLFFFFPIHWGKVRPSYHDPTDISGSLMYHVHIWDKGNPLGVMNHTYLNSQQLFITTTRVHNAVESMILIWFTYISRYIHVLKFYPIISTRFAAGATNKSERRL